MAVLMQWAVPTPTRSFLAVLLMLRPPLRSRSTFCFLRKSRGGGLPLLGRACRCRFLCVERVAAVRAKGIQNMAYLLTKRWNSFLFQ